MTRDGGVNWSPLSNGLPSTLVWSLAFDGPATQTLYAATETGPFVLDAASDLAKPARRRRAGPDGTSASRACPPRTSYVSAPSRGVWDYVPPGGGR